jgi:hypothetical protein
MQEKTAQAIMGETAHFATLAGQYLSSIVQRFLLSITALRVSRKSILSEFGLLL